MEYHYAFCPSYIFLPKKPFSALVYNATVGSKQYVVQSTNNKILLF